MKKIFSNLVSLHTKTFSWPKSDSSLIQRQQFILNILLIGGIYLAVTSVILAVVNWIYYTINGWEFRGASPLFLIGMGIIFSSLLLLSKKGFVKVATFSFLVLLFMIAAGMSFRWGSLVPQAALMYALFIVVAGVLIKPKSVFKLTIFLCFFLTAVIFLQNIGLLQYDRLWLQRTFDLGDAIMTTATLAIITTVSWLYHRQLTDALHRLKRSQNDLKKERDQLEIKVEERTQQLRETQLEQVSQLYRFVEMGRAATSFFHDIRTPLTTVALNLAELTQDHKREHQETAELAKRGMSQIEQYLQAAERQLKRVAVSQQFRLAAEIKNSIATFSQRFKRHHIAVQLHVPPTLAYRGDPIKFQHLIVNLVSNAFDALTNAPMPRKISITASQKARAVTIIIQDTGIGMSAKTLKQIYQPFFTSKPDGFGLGLTLTKRSIEHDFGGTLHCVSKPGKGTTFTISIPSK